ncbi:MAG TPA: T9SS type A sorting domain-containing protein [Edaphocola sp.]|nr:T9SS type A sorting domain-containing protein [Edaphocola sp.]
MPSSGNAVSTNTNLYLTYSGGATLTLPISNAAPSSKPDVILGDDPNNPGVDYIAVVCYQDINGDIIVRDYNITNITGTMIATAGLSQNLGAGSAPKIDGFANNTAPILGLPAMDEFVVVWNKTTLNDIGVYAGEVADVTNSFFLNTYTNAGINPDVAAVKDVISNQLYACMLCYRSASNPMVHVYDINVTAPPTTPPVITNLGGDPIYPRPRIEGMALYKSPAPKWSVVSFADFNSLQYATDLNPSNPIYANPTGNNYAAAIAAGLGPFVPNSSGAIIGNRQITLAWAGVPYAPIAPSVVVSAAFDGSGGQVLLPVPPYNPGFNYKYATVNWDPINVVNVNIDEYEVALAACCNSGKGLIAAWWKGTGSQSTIRYKITPDNDYAFKPTGLEESAQSALSFSVFPNPAAKNLYIKYSDAAIEKVRITNVLGQKVLEEPFKDTPVDISALPSGDYFISITTGDNSVMTRPFVIVR